MRVARGSASLLPSHGRGIWPRDVLKEVSRGLSRVEAGNVSSYNFGVLMGGSEFRVFPEKNLLCNLDHSLIKG